MYRQPLRLDPLPRPGGTHRFRRERRRVRSINSAHAAELALTQAARRAGFDVLLLADDRGMLVVGSETSLDLSLLAAVVPLVARGRARANVRHHGNPRSLAVRRLWLQDESFYLAAVGGCSEGARLRELATSVGALRRILA